MFRRIKSVLRAQLTQGLDARACRTAIASTITIGVFPIIGFATPMNTLAAFFFRLNQPVVQAFNWVLGPLKIALIFPFLRLGEWLFQGEPFTLSLTEFSKRFFSDWQTTTSEFAWTFVHAIVGWLVCVPLIYLAIYHLSRPFVERFGPSDGVESGRSEQS
jgi:uncharacterized protein (DUF2062 family)